MQTTLIDTANLFRLVQFFDVLAAVVFALSGALVASRKGMDVMGFMWLAVITGVGGGTVRDLILSVPVFWVQNPIHVSAPALVAIAMGAVTGAVGGIIRDTLGHVPSVLLRHEIYITASVLGACTYIGLNGLGLARLAAMVAGFLVTFSVRGLAIKFGWSLPVFRESATRERWTTDRRDSTRH